MTQKHMEYQITEDEANTLASRYERVFVVWVDSTPYYFNDFDGAWDFAEDKENEVGHDLFVLDYVTGDYA